MRGIAREVAALTGAPLTLPPDPPRLATSPLATDPASQTAIAAGGLFSVTALHGLRVEPSPVWLRQRLERAGLRPINNVVDITNLVMLETGQPLHAFDADVLKGLAGAGGPAAIGLRQGQAAEPFMGLDGTKHHLDSDALVVTCGGTPVALAGVMGGAHSAVHEGTTAIWLEAAVFSPQAVRRSARSVGLRTEASTRFEKGLPREVTLGAADRAVQLLQELCSARIEGRWVHQSPPEPRPALVLRRDALHQLLGPVVEDGEEQDLGDGRIARTLTALGCVLTPTEEGWSVVVPPSRAMDLQREVDLIEEVARLVGYDNFAAHLPDPIEPGGVDPVGRAERRLRQALRHAGLQETCALSLVPAAEPGESDRVALVNPLLADYSHLRDNLTDELLQAARRNLQSSQPGFWGFEIGTVFNGGAGTPVETRELAGVICAERRSELWSSSGKPTPPDYHRARGALQQALSSLAVPSEDRPLTSNPRLHPGRAAELVIEGRPAGWFGQLHPARAEALDLPEATYLFQLALQPILVAATRRQRWQPTFAPFPTVPASERDLALVVPRTVTAAALLAAIRKAGKPLLESAELLDRYQGEQVDAESVSQAFRLRYREARRTLTESEVEQAHAAIRTALERQFAARLRS
jgi:phenylalanyl-tRNA synthetase beta chain